MPVLAKVKTRTGRIWTYMRDDRPFGGDAPPAAVFFYSPDRASIHPEQHLAGYCGILQADAYAGFNTLYEPDRKPAPITEAGCWAHATQAVRACRHCREGTQPETADDLADRFRGGWEVRCHLRAGALHQGLVARGVRGRKGDAGGHIILYPTEEHVLSLSARWSLDPTKLDDTDIPPTLSLGYIALAPAAWRPERLRKTG